MTLERLRTDDAAWDTFVAASPTPSYLQATPWAIVKRPNGWTSARILGDGPAGPIGAQLLVRRARPLPGALGYAARGPIAGEPLDPAAIDAFTRLCRVEGRRIGISHVRIDPEVEDPDGSLEAALRGAGWLPARELQPQRTRILDLRATEEELWGAVHPKWRKNVRKATRDGITVVPGGAERIADFHAIHRATMDRAGVPVRALRTFVDVHAAFAPSEHAHLLFARDAAGVDVAARLLVGWGSTVVALYSGQTDEGARLRASYPLKWEAIRLAHAAGYATYDLWGLPNRTIADWKAGWGGREVTWIGAWDLVLAPARRTAFEAGVELRRRVVAVRDGRRAGPRRRRSGGSSGEGDSA